MKKELANIIFSKMPESWDADKDRRIMEYLENNLLDPNDAFDMLNGFMKSNHGKIKKLPKSTHRYRSLRFCQYFIQ